MENHRADTVAVLSAVFSSPQLINHIVPAHHDSIYILKSGQVHNWPKKINNYHMFYIDDSKFARTPNYLNSAALDRRLRLGFPVFNLTNDSARVTIFNFNYGSSATYQLKKDGHKWTITNATKGID